MHITHTNQAIILKTWDYADKDLIVSFLTREHGRLQGIAKGAKGSRRRFAGAIDFFSLTDLSFKERKNSTLVFIDQAKLIEGFQGIRSQYDSILLAMGLLEMTYRLHREGEKDSRPFEILLKGLQQLNEKSREGGGQSPSHSHKVFWQSILHHLEVMGLAPQLLACVKCGEDRADTWVGFEARSGGMICRLCHQGDKESLVHEESEILKLHLKHHLDLDLEWERFIPSLSNNQDLPFFFPKVSPRV